MRLLPVAALLALALSGCAGDGPAPATNSEPDGETLPVQLPEDVVFSGSLKGVGYGGFLPVAPPSEVPACALMEQQCAVHSVVVPEGTWNVTFTLEGTNGAVTGTGMPAGTDYDLFVEDVGESTQPSGSKDVVKSQLKAGTYSAEVLAWHDVDGAYKLTVSFAL
jgi:hypothetical protein